MARKTMWAVAGALLAFAPVVSAATYGLTIENGRTYAKESITSGDVVIDYQGVAPRATVWLYLDDPELTAIGRNDTIDLTFTLANATFARNVNASALLPMFNAAVSGCSARVRSADGAAGSASATFTIEASEGNCAGTGGNINFRLTMPALKGLNSSRPVAIRVTTDTPGGSGWPGLDTTGVGTSDFCGQNGGADNSPDGDDNMVCARISDTGVLSSRSEAANNPEMPFINFADGLAFTATSGGASRINLAGGRTAFTWPWQARLGDVRIGVAGAAACTLREAPYGASTSACTLQANGRPFSVGRLGHGRGDLHVTVTGDFRNGDQVFLDLDGNNQPGSGEYLDLQNDGSMQESFSLDRVAGNAGADEGDSGELDREEGVTTKVLWYRPNGQDPLRPGEYRSSYSVTTASANVADKPSQPSTGAHMTSYTLVEGTAKNAYAIPPMRAGDSGMVRVKCEVATHCMLYLECDDQDGMSYFAAMADPVQGRSTMVLTAEDLSSELGLMEGDWETGRMSCSIYSTRTISVQQLTRSSSGVLVNNTYVND